jgi:Fe2+ or Zn2+ uptake regulation protein
MGKEQVLALTVRHDKQGKRDASRAFIPEAYRFVSYWEDQGLVGRVRFVDNHARVHDRRKQVVDALHESENLRHLAIFAHGWRTGIQMGFRLNHLRPLARQIEKVAADDAITVTLYCCSTAQGGPGGDGGFADELRDALCHVGLVHCRVDAHVNKGHTTRNPHVRRFEGGGSQYGGAGGGYLVAPRTKNWSEWRKRLRSEDIRFAFSQMSAAEIVDELHAA